MSHPLKESTAKSERWRTLPEICMVLHMEFTGASDVLSHDEYYEAAEYVASRVAAWKPTSNGLNASTFDTAVLSMCLVVLQEVKRHRDRLAPAVGAPSC